MRLAFADSAARAFGAPAAPYRHLRVNMIEFEPEGSSARP